jgi:hypothetical protein
MSKSYHKLINSRSLDILGVLDVLYEWAMYRAKRLLYLRTSDVSNDQAEVVLKVIPEALFLTVDRGEDSIVQSNLETRGTEM